MKSFKTITVLTFLFLTSVGCDDNSITGSEGRKIVGIGDVITQTVSLSSFSSISNSIPANINVTVGNPQEIVVRAQQNIIDVMVFKVEDSEFRLDFDENVSVTASKRIEVDITVAEINRITSTGVANFLTGWANFLLSGPKQDEMSINISNLVNVEAYELEVDVCSINMAGFAHCKVKVNNILNAVLTGIGSVFYRGNPTINATTSGIGKVIDDN